MLDTQILYDGRWVSRQHFKAFVYNSEGSRLAKSYQEFTDLITSGVWKAEKPKVIAEKLDDNVIDIKPKRGRKCQSQHKA